MAIFRGVGGSGDSSDNSYLQEVTAQANAASSSASAASASASAASTSASNSSDSADDAESAKLIAQSSASTAVDKASIATTQAGIATSQAGIATTKASEAAASAATAQNLEISSASFDTADGTLTLTKANSGTVTTDLDGRYLTTHQDISGKADLSGADFTGDVTTTGEVGIGTDSPAYTLDIESTSPIIKLEDTDTNTQMFLNASSGVGGFNFDFDSTSVASAPYAAFNMSGTEAMRINSSGNVGIGEINPNKKLHIKDGDVRIESAFPRLYLTDTDSNSDYSIINNNGKFSIYDDTNTQYRMAIDSSGNVGIGTTSPQAKLHVNGGDLKITSDDANNGADGIPSILFNEATGSSANAQISYHGDDEITVDNYIGLGVFDSSVSSADTLAEQKLQSTLAVTRDNKVGINIIRPTEALDVVGNIKASGTLATGGYTLPSTDGTDGQALVTDGNGNVSFDDFNVDVSGKANLSGATFTGNVNIGLPPSGTQSLTVAGSSTLYGGVTGGLDVTGTVTAPNVDISTTGSVTTNIATGADNNNNTDVKVVNIGTGYGGSTGAGDSTTINMGSQDTFAKNIFNIGNGVTVENGSTINLKGTVNVDGNVNVGSKITGSTDGVVLEHEKTTDLEPVLELQNTRASGSGYRGAFISMTGYNTSGTEYTRGVIGMGNSTAQYSFPYIAANITSVSCGIKLSGSTGTTYNALTPCDSIGASLNNGMQCGHPFYKWNTVYATNGNIATSDQTHKRDVEELSEAETRVAVACKGLLRKYRWKDAYEEKGEEARIHFGIMAQDLRDAFSAQGLDASRYAMFCSDTWWEDETGERHEEQDLAPEGAVETIQLGVRYDELLAFIIAAI